MSEPSIFFSEVNERQGVFHRRAFLMGGLAGVSLAALGGRLAYLQLIQAGRYQKLAAGNQFNFQLVPPPRGLILDRNGVSLASNRPNFRLLVAREDGMDVDATMDEIAKLVPLDPDRVERLKKDIKRAPRKQPVAVMEDMSWEEFSRINIRAPELPGVTADMGEVRVYPYGGAFAHVIGYVAKISERDLTAAGANPDPLLLNPGFRIGRQGVERAFDGPLRGRAGATKAEVDAQGRVVKMDPTGDIAATPGKEVRLTLDADIQNRALEVFGEESGAAVVMDCRNGDVLCMASAPSFDANAFVRGVSVADYRALSTYERKPLLDKALSGTFPPGSTFKTMVALAALENGFNPAQTYTCHGVFPFGNHVFHCDKSHGTLDLHGAIVTSCDVYFYQAALSCGPDKIATVARAFGLGQIFDIGIDGQKRGVVPDRAWKKEYFKKRPANQQVWYPGETPSMGIGQGFVNVNPLQLCVMVARLANGQKALNPRLVKSVGGVDQPSGAAVPDLPVAREHLQLVRQAMADVTKTGTAAASGALGLGPIMMAGKTGTAQSHTYAAGARTSRSLGWALRDHAWFVAFAPYDDPRYAISVLVEHGGFGAAAAAPRAREIMRTTLLKDPEIVRRIEASGQAILAAAPQVDVGVVDEAAPAAEPTPIGPAQ
jgi:penicillin-binding protein 2